MSDNSVGGISFDLSLNLGNLQKQLQSIAAHADAKISRSFQAAGTNAEAAMQRVKSQIDAASSSLSRQALAIEEQKNKILSMRDAQDLLRSKYDQQTAAIDAQKQKLAEQTAAVDQQKQKVAELQQQYDQANQSGGSGKQEDLQRLSQALQEAKTRLGTMEKAATASKNRLDKLNNAAAGTRSRMSDTARSVELAKAKLGLMETEANETRSRISYLNNELNELSQAASEAGNNVGDAVQDMSAGSNSSFDSMSGGITGVGDTVGEQSSRIGGFAKKMAVAFAAAFSVQKLVSFGKECLELGSDLQEVQNVVDVTFPSMSSCVDDFAKSAAASFGLSETMAKQYAGTFGSMAKAFGFSEQQALDMGTALTGLAGDVASFYNLSQDEAYTKLKSVFTGETESLKDLGVVMTQTALDSYALANGYGKTTKSMTEAEKVALRYAFVQDQLSAAAGDFSRTSGGWANQVRVLNLQFDSLKATIGQGLINAFTPIIKLVNTLIGRLSVLAEQFLSWTEGLFGASDSGSGLSGTAEGITAAAVAAENLANQTEAAGTAAQQTAKDMKSLMGFDAVQKLSEPESTSASTGATGTGSANMEIGSSLASDMSASAKEADNLGKSLKKLQGYVDKLLKPLKRGFRISFGDSLQQIDTVKAHLDDIQESASSLFRDTDVSESVSYFIQSISTTFGQYTGSIASIGVTLASNLLGGLSRYLDENSGYISERLSSIFDSLSDTSSMQGDMASAAADIFSVFRSPDAEQMTADLTGILSDTFLFGIDMTSKFQRDMTQLLSTPITDNVGGIKEALDNTISPASDALSTLHDSFQDTFSSFTEMYEEHIQPLFENLSDGISDIVDTALEAYNVHIAPVLDDLSDKFSETWEDHIQPAIDGAIDLIGKLADAVNDIWEKTLQPLIQWIVRTIIPVIAPIIKQIGQFMMSIWGVISDVFSCIWEALGGLIDFVAGVFTGDWKRAWEGITTYFQKKWEGIQTFFSGIWESIKELFAPIVEWFQEKFEDAAEAVEEAFSGIGEFFGGVWDGIKEAFGNITGWFKEKFTDAWESVKGVFSDGGEIFVDIKDGVLDGLKSVINKLIDGINKVIAVPFNGINDALEGIKDIKILGKKPFDFIPTISVPVIPKLAQGGYVEKNTPQLAMIGDNRHQGEIVAPEDKLREMAEIAASGGNLDLLKRIIDLLEVLISLVQDGGDIVLAIDGEELARAAITGSLRLKRRHTTVEVDL